MWVLVLIALNTNLVLTVPGNSMEETRSAGAKEVIATIADVKHHLCWSHHCVKTS
jgi:hypothetical protein